MEQMVVLDGIVTGFNVTEHCIDCMRGKNLIKIDKLSVKSQFLRKMVYRGSLLQMRNRFLSMIFVHFMY